MFRFISSLACVRWATIFLLGASVWQHLFSDPSYRAFLWDPFWTSWTVKILTGMEWRTYLLGPRAEATAQVFTWTMAVILMLGLVGALLLSPRRPWAKFPLFAASAVLGFEAFCTFLDVSHQVPMLMELSLRVGTPSLLAAVVLHGWTPRIRLFTLVMTALTFSGHGLYALGMGVPVPGNFVDMVMETLGMSQASSLVFLTVAGVLDQLLIIGLLVPLLRPATLGYCAAWGTATSLARITSYVRLDNLLLLSLYTYLPEFFVRAPHFLIPMALLIWHVSERQIPRAQHNEVELKPLT